MYAAHLLNNAVEFDEDLPSRMEKSRFDRLTLVKYVSENRTSAIVRVLLCSDPDPEVRSIAISSFEPSLLAHVDRMDPSILKIVLKANPSCQVSTSIASTNSAAVVAIIDAAAKFRFVPEGSLDEATARSLVPLVKVPYSYKSLYMLSKTPSLLRDLWLEKYQGEWTAALKAYQDLDMKEYRDIMQRGVLVLEKNVKDKGLIARREKELAVVRETENTVARLNAILDVVSQLASDPVCEFVMLPLVQIERLDVLSGLYESYGISRDAVDFDSLQRLLTELNEGERRPSEGLLWLLVPMFSALFKDPLAMEESLTVALTILSMHVAVPMLPAARSELLDLLFLIFFCPYASLYKNALLAIQVAAHACSGCMGVLPPVRDALLGEREISRQAALTALEKVPNLHADFPESDVGFDVTLLRNLVIVSGVSQQALRLYNKFSIRLQSTKEKLITSVVAYLQEHEQDVPSVVGVRHLMTTDDSSVFLIKTVLQMPTKKLSVAKAILEAVPDLVPTSQIVSVVDMLVNKLVSTVPQHLASNPLVKDCLFQSLEAARKSERDDIAAVAIEAIASLPPSTEALNATLQALQTPSDQVQYQCAKTLSLQLKHFDKNIDKLYAEFIQQLWNSRANYAARRAAAYGVAAVVNAGGLRLVKENKLFTNLPTPPTESVYLLIETLSLILGRRIEAYIPVLMPILLADPSNEAMAVFLKVLTPPGVSLMLPILYSHMNSRDWRIKASCLDILGLLAHVASSIVGSYLPSIVPRLIESLHDAHYKVAENARKALTLVGGIIRNNEIKNSFSVYLKLLENPSKQNIREAMYAIQSTRFVTAVDPASLSIFVPVLEKCLDEDKKSTSLIIANLSDIVANAADLRPYGVRIIEPLKKILGDPVPDNRLAAAKAIGAVAKSLALQVTDYLIARIEDSVGIDRYGAAIAVAEVAHEDEETVKYLVSQLRHQKAYIREGYLLAVGHMATLGGLIEEYMEECLNEGILPGLADEAETVRKAALRAGQLFVESFAHESMSLLLPAIERGLFEGDYRIRHASLVLLGDLLRFLSKTDEAAQKEEADSDASDDEEAAAEDGDDSEYVPPTGQGISEAAVRRALGDHRTDQLLAAIYMLRLDSDNTVRMSASQLFRAIVSNPARVLRVIMSTVMRSVINAYANTAPAVRALATNTIHELCARLPDRVMNELSPLMEAKSAADREAVCLALCDVLEGPASKRVLLGSSTEILDTMRGYLSDENESVRVAASAVLDAIMQSSGAKSIESLIIPLLHPEGFDALKELLELRAHTVIPIVMQHLDVKKRENVGLLSNIALVAKSHMAPYVCALYDEFLTLLYRNTVPFDDSYAALFRSLAQCLDDSVMEDFLHRTKIWIDRDVDATRRAIATILLGFVEQNELSAEYAPRLFVLLLEHAEAVFDPALQILVSQLASKKEEAFQDITLLRDMQMSMESHMSSLSRLGKSAHALASLLSFGIANAPNMDSKLASVHLMCLVLRNVPIDTIKAQLMILVGPIIRILGDALRAAAVLEKHTHFRQGMCDVLAIALERAPQSLKALFPQIQTTLLKAVADATLMKSASVALAQLVLHVPRPDALMSELVKERHFYPLERCLMVKDPASSKDLLDLIVAAASPKDEAAIRCIALLLAKGNTGVSFSDFWAANADRRVLLAVHCCIASPTKMPSEVVQWATLNLSNNIEVVATLRAIRRFVAQQGIDAAQVSEATWANWMSSCGRILGSTTSADAKSGISRLCCRIVRDDGLLSSFGWDSMKAAVAVLAACCKERVGQVRQTAEQGLRDLFLTKHKDLRVSDVCSSPADEELVERALARTVVEELSLHDSDTE
jgi:hypothetical protein